MVEFTQSLRQGALILLLALIPAIVALFFHPRSPARSQPVREGEITLQDALAARSVLWIDARPAGQYAQEHIPGALPLNEDEWNVLLPAVLGQWNPGQVAVVYCSSQSCQASHEVAARLREFKLGPVFALAGGWEAWVNR